MPETIPSPLPAALEEIRALTIRQPWAHFIAYCGKSVENRSQPTRHRGLLAIHGGSYARWDASAEQAPAAVKAWHEWAHIPARGELAAPLTRSGTRDARLIDFGAVIAAVRVTGCHHADDCGVTVPGRPGLVVMCTSWAAEGQWHWELADVRPLAYPVPCKGMLGLWRLPDDAEKSVRAQLSEDGEHG